MVALKYICVIIGAYLIGNINIALLISKLKKKDVRKLGSGNPGSMNMFRNFGIKLGLLTLGLDALKGAIPTLLGWLALGDAWSFGANKIGAYIGGFCVIVGHIFPIFLKFKGGKGIASSIGVCLVFNPIATVLMFAIGVGFILLTKIGSITSFIIISIPIALEGFKVSSSELGSSTMLISCIMLFSLFALTVFAHRNNIHKLFLGKESKTVFFGKNKSAKKAAELSK